MSRLGIAHCAWGLGLSLLTAASCAPSTESDTSSAGSGGASAPGAGAANSGGTAATASGGTEASAGSSGVEAGSGGEAGAPASERGGASSGGKSSGRGGGSAQSGGRSSTGGAGSLAGGDGGEAGGPAEPGAVPKEFAGIWQETRSSSSTYQNGWGEKFDMTQGFSVQLKMRENGSYYYANFAKGVSASCASVSYFDQSVGNAVLADDALDLYPRQRRLDVTDCSGARSQTLANDPIPFQIGVSETRNLSGLRTYSMKVQGAPQPLDLKLLFEPPPLFKPIQPKQPADFIVGDTGAYKDFQGLWVLAAGTDSDFFNPETGKFYFPDYNGSPHVWMRIVDDQYETAMVVRDLGGGEGVCRGDAIYYEQGRLRFAVKEDVGGTGTHFVGDARLEATAARLIIQVTKCDEDDATFTYDVTPLTSYYRFIYFTPGAGVEELVLSCDYPQSEWQMILCQQSLGFLRRE